MPIGIYKRTDEYKKQRSEFMKKNPLNYWLGKKRSKEEKLKMSLSHKGRPAWNKGKNGLKLSKHPNWKGGRTVDTDGYIWIKMPTHPYRKKSGYILEHRLIMEKKLGRYLRPEEVVHHINGIKDDNRIKNLLLFKNQTIHAKFEKGLTLCPQA